MLRFSSTMPGGWNPYAVFQSKQKERPPKQTLLFVFLVPFERLTAYLPMPFRRGMVSVFVSLQTVQV